MKKSAKDGGAQRGARSTKSRKGFGGGKKLIKQRIGLKSFLWRCLIVVVYVAIWAGLLVVAVKMKDDGSFEGVDSATVNASTQGVAVMEIELNGVTLAEIQENPKSVKYKNNILSLDGELFYGVEVKGRGNFSWMADKKSYRIKFPNKVALLGMPPARKWALVANSADDSLMRNDLAYYLTSLVVGEYPFRGEFVELKVDGAEQGLYYLIRAMDIGKYGVALSDPMGVLVEMDNVYCEEEEAWYETWDNNCLTLKAALVDDNADSAMADFLAVFSALEEAAEDGKFGEVERIIDVESFAKYYLVSELTANPDAYITSWFFYRDGLDDKIHAGLTWDFDASFGNYKWGGDICKEGFYAPTVETVQMVDGTLRSSDVKASMMMYRLLENEDFKKMVGQIYYEKLFGKWDEINEYIDVRKREISDAAMRNAILWGDGDFEVEVEYVRQWLFDRMEYLEQKLAGYL